MKLFARIEKIDEEQRIVEGYATTEALDAQGEIVSKDAITNALPDYMKFGNIREMHQAKAAGVVQATQIDEKGLRIIGKIVDNDAWIKVKEKVYKGFSIGGKMLEKVGDTITSLQLTEISLVDRPANPEALITLWKADGVQPEGDDKSAVIDDKDANNGDQVTKTDDGDNKTDPEPDPDEVYKRQFSAEQRKRMARSGEAMSDGSYPIANKQDLENAVRAYGRAKNKQAVKRHIIRRARALDAVSMLPKDWNVSDKADDPTDVQKLQDVAIEKGMSAVARLAWLLQELDYETQDAEVEAEIEGDGSTLPAKLRAARDQLAECLRDMATEETQELTDGITTSVQLSVDPTDVKKADPDNKATMTLDIANMPEFKKLADQVGDLNKSVETLTKQNETVTKERDEALAKADDLKKQLDALPEPPKGNTKAVDKSGDKGNTDAKKADETPKDALSAIRKAQMQPHVLTPSGQLQRLT